MYNIFTYFLNRQVIFMRKSLYQWCLENDMQILLDQWMTKSNFPWTPYNVAYGSREAVKWQCRDCGCIWTSRIDVRTSGRKGCPECGKKQRVIKRVKRILEKYGSLAEKYPHLLSFWDYDKNSILPTEISPHSLKKVWWKCEFCGRSYEASVRLRACPFCKVERRIKTWLAKSGSLYDKMPHLEKEWVIEKNNGLTIRDVTPASNKKYVWKCEKCNHEWQASAKARLSGNGCPACHGYAASETDNLYTLVPQAAALWHPTKNGTLTPKNVRPYSEKKVWWKCPVCNGEWEDMVGTVSRFTRCPYCSGRRVLKGFNDFPTLYPELAKEWNYNKNQDLKPDDYTSRSHRKVWWKCTYGHEWQATIDSRVKNPECPCCAGKVRVVTLYEEQWMNNYEYAKQYFEQHKNLDVPVHYTTENGIKLGVWLRTQRTSYKNGYLTAERKKLLESIGMIWVCKMGRKKKQ